MRVDDETPVDVQQLYKEFAREAASRATAEQEARERAEFERLKQKYER